MKKNNKGFTMIELLAVIVILGILSVISVAAVQGIITKAKERYYKSQEDNMVMATQSYLSKNNRKQPKISGQIVDIKLKELLNAKYIDKVVDYKKETCDIENSFVRVFKYEDKLYYTALLTCPNREKSMANLTSNLKIENNFEGNGNNLQAAKTKFEIEDTASGETPKGIISYQYRLYKDNKLIYTSDVYNAKKSTTVNRTVILSDYVPGKIKISITATNILGLSKTKSFSFNYKDVTGPECQNPTGESIVWASGTRTISVGCDDKGGSGCKQSKFTYKFTGDVKEGKIIIEDKEGNKTPCKVNVYLDNSSPEVTIKAYKKKADSLAPAGSVMNQVSNSKNNPNASLKITKDTNNGWLNKSKWTNGVYLELIYKDVSSVKNVEWKWNDANLKANSSALKTLKNINNQQVNNASGTVKEKIVYDGYRYGEVVVTDQLGHKSVIQITAPLDRVPPTMPVTGESTTWTSSDRSLNIGCSDAISGCETPPGAQRISTTTKTKNYAIKDKAGNTYARDVNAYVDKTSPSCSSISGASTSWTKNDRSITVACRDNESGCRQNQYTNNFNTSTKVGKITIYDKVGNKRDCNVNAYVDKTAPSCGSISGASTSWTKNNRTIKVNCSDSHSGCTNGTFSQTFSASTKQGTIQIKDKVGNTNTCQVNAYVDKDIPSCGNVSGASTSWTRDDRRITVACNDSGGSGCSSVSKTFSSTTKNGTITLKDGAGNTRNCSVNAYVDKTAPSCSSISGASTSWTKNDRSITVTCGDNESGCRQSQYTNNFNTTTKVGNITIYDKVGNKRDCNVNAYVDKTAPSCGSISGASTSWTNSNRTIKVNCSDSHSGCTNGTFSQTFSSSTKQGTIQIKDKVGNTKSCQVNAYVDKDIPSCGNVSGASTSWTNSNRRITVACNDSGGSGCNSVSKTFSSTIKNGTITLKDGAGNSRNCSVNAYVDKTKPSCNGSRGASTNWTANDRYVSVGCKDNNSGCGSSWYGYNFNYTVWDAWLYIYDRAGNENRCLVDVYVDKDPPYSPAITGFSDFSSGAYVSNDSCTGRGDDKNSYSCSYKLNWPKGKRYSFITYTSNRDRGSGIRETQYTYVCSGGSGATYRPNWTTTPDVWPSSLSSGNGSTSCTTKVRGVDKVGHIGPTATLTEYFNRYR